jgi:hypothetical protein
LKQERLDQIALVASAIDACGNDAAQMTAAAAAAVVVVVAVVVAVVVVVVVVVVVAAAAAAAAAAAEAVVVAVDNGDVAVKMGVMIFSPEACLAWVRAAIAWECFQVVPDAGLHESSAITD